MKYQNNIIEDVNIKKLILSIINNTIKDAINPILSPSELNKKEKIKKEALKYMATDEFEELCLAVNLDRDKIVKYVLERNMKANKKYA